MILIKTFGQQFRQNTKKKIEGIQYRGESLSKFLREILGYRDKQSIQGLRSMDSTLLNETLKHNYDVIEKALAHKDTNDIRAIYITEPNS
ncbi:MAG: hypothetical protein K2I05_01090 [Mailhella sp.]|nr:hypothetical protein [Mailhella sp.]